MATAPHARPMLAWLSRPTPVWSSKLLDAVVLAYAAFTVCSHAVTFAGGTPRTLSRLVIGLALAGLAAVVALAVRARASKPAAGPSPSSNPDPDPDPNPDPDSNPEPFDPRRLLLVGLGLIVLVLWLTLRSPLVLWLCLLAYFLIAYADSLRGAVQVPTEPTRVKRSEELLVFALAALCAFLALYAHRYRNDDCYYINLAVTLVDAPDAPLLAEHSIHEPLPNSPRSNAVFFPYRVHSWETLGGALALLIGVEPIRVVHIGMAAVAAGLIPLAFARLFRLLDPRRWAFMLLAAMGLYLFEGSSGLGFASQGIVRSFTGKSVLLSVIVPLMICHAIALAARPSRRAFVRLVTAQIAAIGLSSTALWLAPVATMLATVLPLAPRLRSLRAIAIGLLSCGYVVAAALLIRAQLMGRSSESSEGGVVEAAVAVRHASGLRPRWDLIEKGLAQPFEHPRVIAAFVCLMVLAAALAPTRVARRYVAVFCGTLAIFFMNPFLANFVRHNVTGEFTGQRAMWLAPVPTAFAVVFAALIPTNVPRLVAGARAAAAALAVALFLSVVPTRSAVSAANNVRWGWPPGPKVPTSAFKVVEYLRTKLEVGDVVLAPELVSWYLPTLTRHPYPLLANAKYLTASRSEDRRRERLVEVVTQRNDKLDDKTHKALAKSVRDDGLDAIVVSTKASRTKGLQQAIGKLGFQRAKGATGYSVWIARSRD